MATKRFLTGCREGGIKLAEYHEAVKVLQHNVAVGLIEINRLLHDDYMSELRQTPEALLVSEQQEEWLRKISRNTALIAREVLEHRVHGNFTLLSEEPLSIEGEKNLLP